MTLRSPAVSTALWICDVNGVLVDTSAILRDAFAATADPYARRQYHLRLVRERLHEVRAYPGVQDVLALARASGIRVAATTSYGAVAEACLVSTGLYPYIDCLVTQEEVRRPKPHPEALLRILHLFDATVQQGRHEGRLPPLYVGDTTADIEAGKAVGIRTIGVTYGLATDMEIRAAQPDAVIDSFYEMRSFLDVSEFRRTG